MRPENRFRHPAPDPWRKRPPCRHGEEAGHNGEEKNGSCMAGKGSRLGARQVPATEELREHCRQHYRQHYRQTEHRRGVWNARSETG